MSKYKSDRSWKEFIAGFFARFVVVSEDNSTKETTWKLTLGGTLAASASVTTEDVSIYLSCDTLTVTNDDAVNEVTWDIQKHPGSKATLIVTGDGAITIVSTCDGQVSNPIGVKTTLDAGQPASGLSAGTYYIED